MIKNLVLSALLLTSCTPAPAKRMHLEDFYVSQTCPAEYKEKVNSDGTRTDCLSKFYAIEYDFANSKWAECIGQALHYSRLQNKFPACVLIIEKPNDCKYINRAKGLGVYIQVLDYVNYCNEPRLNIEF